MQKLWVYNFNKTIYKGNVNFDFLFFALSKKISIIFYLPIILFYKFLSLFRIIDKKRYIEKFYSFMVFFDDKNFLVEDFWKKYSKKIDDNFLATINSENKKICVTSDVPEFLFKEFFELKYKVMVIGNKYNLKTGNIDGKYCDGKEKLKRLKNKKIDKIYTCLEEDLPLVNMANESFYACDDKVTIWNDKIIRKKRNSKVAFGLFIFFLTFYLIIGVFLSYNYDFKNNYDLLFDSDTARVIGDFSNILGDHYRIRVHPLYVIFIEPIILFFNGITNDSMLSLIIFSSLISSLSVVVLYLIGSIFSDNKLFKILICSLFGFSFTYFVFTAGIEVYNVAAFFLILLWYQTIKIFKSKDVSNKNIFFLVLLGISSVAFTVTNYFIFLIVSLILLFSKKISLKKILFVNILVVVLTIGLSYVQNLVWSNTTLIYESEDNYKEEEKYTDYNVTLDKIKDVFKDVYINSLVASKLSVETSESNSYMITFGETRVLSVFAFIVFYGLVLYFVIRNFRKNLWLNIGVILALSFNTCLHLVYGSQPFLYSCHFLYLPFLLLFINYKPFKNERKNKILNYVLLMILLIEFTVNFIDFRFILSVAGNILHSNYFRSVMSGFDLLFLILLITFACYILIYLIYKNIIKKDKKVQNVFSIVVCFYTLSLIFIGIKTAPVHEKLFGIQLDNINQREVKEVVKKDNDEIKRSFASEYESYLDYCDEYDNFINNYSTELVDVGPDDYYLFGFGNRLKLLYKDGMITDTSTGKVLYKWNVSKYLIIPNEYMVVLITKDGKKVKIYENEDGVFVCTDDNKEIIRGTDKYINLESFNNQKYKNMKKVLYGEILFNIKNSMPYPNIFVYDKPWYRDAAMMAMVLKQTDNVELIDDWISSIDDVYDKQNADNAEPDNLGELLYIVSISKNDHNDLIEDIRMEALKNASNNENGFYLHGFTDGGYHDTYQNKWYNFGMKSLGFKNSFANYDTEDSYDGLTWWYGKSSTAYFENNLSEDYPYLSIAQYHKTGRGKIYLNKNLYPISYEKKGSEANYKKMKVIDSYLVNNEISPLHTWTASELLLFLLDETGNLK